MEIREEGYHEVGGWRRRGGCWTLRRGGCRIPVAAAVCPPPPKKKRHCWYGKTGKREPPKNGYFKPPDDLELLFSVPPRHQSSLDCGEFEGGKHALLHSNISMTPYQILKFPIDLEHFEKREQLKKSGIAKVIMFLSKSAEETTNKKLAKIWLINGNAVEQNRAEFVVESIGVITDKEKAAAHLKF
ncbi:hypothetical protein RHMOL_Rhmol10G0248700 [Rhododendron molle]|uniref:Uncharacterized protein n=1 Tax=Rhododendron molle TaxID=49168 RepID=A0ACC0M5V1_RHOML|nr:hypothetical protein RHMOL_Rhmol10G0248700 [Rhododendron molle]